MVLDAGLFLFICFGQSTRNIAPNLEGAFYTLHTCIVTNLEAEQSTFERLINKVCASSGEPKLAVSLRSIPIQGLKNTMKKTPSHLSLHLLLRYGCRL